MTYIKKLFLIIIFILSIDIAYANNPEIINELNYLIGKNNYFHEIDKINNSIIISIYPDYNVNFYGEVITNEIDLDYIKSVKTLLESKYPENDLTIITLNKLPKEFENELTRRKLLRNFFMLTLLFIASLMIFMLFLSLYKNRKGLKKIENIIFKNNDITDSLHLYVEKYKKDFIILHLSNTNFKNAFDHFKPEILFENKFLLFYNYYFIYKSILLETSFSKKISHENIIKIRYVDYLKKVNKILSASVPPNLS